MVDQTVQKQKVEAAIASLKRNARVDAMAAPVAASLIVAAVFPCTQDNPGAMFYRLKAERWLTLLLTAETELTLEQLAERMRALASVSTAVQSELGGLPGRLNMLVSAA